MTSAHSSDDVRILKKQCVSLAKNENNQVFLVAKGDSFEYKRVKVVGIGEVTGGRLNRMFKVSKIVYDKAISLDADVYQFHDPELLPYAKRLKKLGKKVIFDSHENYKVQIMEKDYIPKAIRWAVRWMYAVIETSACKNLDAVLYPAQDSPYEGKVKKCIPISNAPMVEELKMTRAFDEKEDSVCCVGTLTEDRGIGVLINACYKAGVKLVLGGKFSPPEFENSLRKLDSFSIVDYRGYCDREKVNEIYNECLIGADTILRVGQYPYLRVLATKTYEYMLMEMPYITSDFAYCKEVINKYKSGMYVDPADEEAIANAIIFLLSHKEAAKEMGINGKKAIEKEFNWQFDEERLLGLYEQLYAEQGY